MKLSDKKVDIICGLSVKLLGELPLHTDDKAITLTFEERQLLNSALTCAEWTLKHREMLEKCARGEANIIEDTGETADGLYREAYVFRFHLEQIEGIEGNETEKAN